MSYLYRASSPAPGPVEVGCFVLCSGEGDEPYRVLEQGDSRFYLEALNPGVPDAGWESTHKLSRISVRVYREIQEIQEFRFIKTLD